MRAFVQPAVAVVTGIGQTACSLQTDTMYYLRAMAFNPRLAFDLPELQLDWQSQALRSLLRYLSESSPFYRRRFREKGVDIHAIRSMDDLHLLPLTDKTDIQEHNWDFLCIPREEVREYMTTSGTLGRPVTVALSANDLQRLSYNEQQSFRCTGTQPGDSYQLMLTLDRQFMAGIAYYTGLRELGAALIRTGPGLPAMQWETIRRLQPDSIVAVPSFILKMIEWAKEHGISPESTSVRKAVCIGEGLRGQDFSLNTLGSRIVQDWPLELYSTYASTEMQTAFTECSAGRGGHQQPDLVLAEILDEEGKSVPEGEYGELTITTLGVEAMPLLRYRTGDICALHHEPCSCGRHSARLSPVLGRRQQMIKYKGTTLYPPALFDLLNEATFVREYVVEVSSNELGTDELRLHLLTPLAEEDCSTRLRPLLQSRLRVVPALNFLSAEAMQQMQFPPASRKQLRFIDKRTA